MVQNKKVKIFGFELNTHVHGSLDVDGCSKNIDEEEGDNGSSGCKAEEKSRRNEKDYKKYECQFCFKEFANSQALGGHQNAHKKERQMKKRLQLQAKKTNLNCSFLHPLQSYGFKKHAAVAPWSYDRNLYMTADFITSGNAASSRSPTSCIMDESPGFKLGNSDESTHFSGFFTPNSSSLSSASSMREALDFSTVQTMTFKDKTSANEPLLLAKSHGNQ